METFQTVTSPDVVDVLRREHEQIRQLCTDLRRAAPDRRTEPLEALRRAVGLHHLGERAIAHPAIRNTGPDGTAAARTGQAGSAQIDRSLAELCRLGGGHPGFDTAFATLSGALIDHADRQENDEFPLLRRHVPVQRLHMMASAMSDVRAMALL